MNDENTGQWPKTANNISFKMKNKGRGGENPKNCVLSRKIMFFTLIQYHIIQFLSTLSGYNAMYNLNPLCFLYRMRFYGCSIKRILLYPTIYVSLFMCVYCPFDFHCSIVLRSLTDGRYF